MGIEVVGVAWLIIMLALVVLAVREERRSKRRWDRTEAARQAWLADPTNADLYRQWLRS